MLNTHQSHIQIGYRAVSIGGMYQKVDSASSVSVMAVSTNGLKAAASCGRNNADITKKLFQKCFTRSD
jgi:hypothetical protein